MSKKYKRRVYIYKIFKYKLLFSFKKVRKLVLNFLAQKCKRGLTNVHLMELKRDKKIPTLQCKRGFTNAHLAVQNKVKNAHLAVQKRVNKCSACSAREG